MTSIKYEWVDASGWQPDYVAKNWPMFSFGSNLDVGQLNRRAPNAQFQGIARINYARLWFAGQSKKHHTGVATLRQTKDHNAYAVGVLFKMTAADVANMDTFEGNGRAYKRMLVTVVCAGKPVRAFTYVHTSIINNAPWPQYVTTIAAGYRFWGLDPELLRAAVARSPAAPDPKPSRGWYDSRPGRTAPLPFDATDSERDDPDEPEDAHNSPVVMDIAGLEYRAAPGGGYVATAKYRAPAGRPRSTPGPAKAFRRDGRPLNPESDVEPHDCDCPNYRKSCSWSGCPRFDNRDLAGEGK